MELTARDRYCIREIGEEKIRSSRRPDKVRSAAEIKRFLVRVRSSPKYSRAKAAMERLDAEMKKKETKFSELEDAFWEFRRAMKYQGWKKMRLVAAEKNVEGKTDEEIYAMMMGDAL